MFIAKAKELNSSGPFKVDELNEELLRDFAFGASGDVCPMQAVIGGTTAQEIMKVCVIKYRTGAWNYEDVCSWMQCKVFEIMKVCVVKYSLGVWNYESACC